MVGAGAGRTGDGKPEEDNPSPNSLRGVKKRHIQRALAASGNNIREAAELLRVSEQELRRLMRQLGIEDVTGVPKRHTQE